MLVMGYVLIVYLFIFVLICVEMIFILCLYYKDENEEVFLFFIKIYNIFICLICKKRFGVVEIFLLYIDLEKVKEFNDEKKLELLLFIWKKFLFCLDKICFISNLFVVVFVVVIFFLFVIVKL